MDTPTTTAHPVCARCGAPLVTPGRCAYDEPEERAPWRGDYAAMNAGLMTHAEHALVVARWGLHDRVLQSQSALRRFDALARAAWGQAQRLFPLAD